MVNFINASSLGISCQPSLNTEFALFITVFRNLTTVLQ